MNTTENKAIAAEFFARLSAQDTAGAMELLTEGVNWWIAGKPSVFPSAGTYNKKRLTRLFQTILGQLKSGIQMTVKSAIAEDNKVALEVESYGELTNGRIYQQEYHFLMEFQDGKISAVKEYIDTQHAYEIWFAPVPATAE